MTTGTQQEGFSVCGKIIYVEHDVIDFTINLCLISAKSTWQSLFFKFCLNGWLNGRERARVFAKQSLFRSTTDPPTDHPYLALLSGFIWIESLACCMEFAT